VKILLISKHSKYEWERKQLSLTHDELVSKYNKERANLDAIMEAHEKQLHVRTTFKRVFTDSKFCMMHELSDTITDYDMVMVLGGDNAFTYVSHYIKNIPVLGINSDPDRSTGHLLKWSATDDQSIFDLAEVIDFHHYGISKWTRLEATIDGKVISPATSEYFFGERMRKNMSRHILVYRDKEYEQKCSGILFTTGAGSTGWAHSSSNIPPWDPSDKYAGFVVTEPYMSECNGGELLPGEELTLYSLNDSEGYASSDSWEEFEFMRGSEAKIYIGSPLNIMIPKRV